MAKTRKQTVIDRSSIEMWHSALDAMGDRLRRVMEDAEKVDDREARKQIVQSANNKMSVVRRLRTRKRLEFDDPTFSEVRVGLLLLQDSVAMRLHGLNRAVTYGDTLAFNGRPAK